MILAVILHTSLTAYVVVAGLGNRYMFLVAISKQCVR